MFMKIAKTYHRPATVSSITKESWFGRSRRTFAQPLVLPCTAVKSQGHRGFGHTRAVAMQQIDAPLTRCATFLVLSVAESPDAIKDVQATLASVDDLVKNVALRDNKARFACTTAIGSNVWSRITAHPKPKELRPLPVLQGKKHACIDARRFAFSYSLRSPRHVLRVRKTAA